MLSDRCRSHDFHSLQKKSWLSQSPQTSILSGKLIATKEPKKNSATPQTERKELIFVYRVCGGARGMEIFEEEIRTLAVSVSPPTSTQAFLQQLATVQDQCIGLLPTDNHVRRLMSVITSALHGPHRHPRDRHHRHSHWWPMGRPRIRVSQFLNMFKWTKMGESQFLIETL